jgi:cytoskeleton protein RodZ
MTGSNHTLTEEGGDLASRRIQLHQISGEAQPRTVGEDLCAARLRRGDDVATVSRALRISKHHLQALEDGRVEDLPGRTYAIGFVRSYAGYLGLNSAELVDRFKGEIVGRGDGAPQIGWTPEAGGGGLPYGWVIMAIIVVAVVGYGAWYLVRSADVLSSQAVAPVPARIASAPMRRPALQAQSVEARARTLPGTGGGGNGASAGTSAPQGASTAVAGATASQGEPTAALPPGQVYGLQNRDARVVLHVRAVTQVLVEGPGGRVYINRVLHPGDIYRVPALVGLSLTTPDGGAIALELDGQDIGLAGRAGQMTEALSLDPQAIVDRSAKGNPG